MRLALTMTAALLTAGVAAAGPNSGTPATGKKAAPISQRFAATADETPDFQKHVVPLLGKLGCNGRACHGAFSGQGGFQLSLFGYDFNKDREGLLERVDTDDSAESYALHKALNLDDDHEGGERMKRDSWEYRVFEKWIAGGAEGAEDPAVLESLVVSPAEITFKTAGDSARLNVTAVWSDGTSEDVTPLTRFATNDDQIALVSEDGTVTAKEPGDTHVVAFYDNGITPVPVIRPVSEQIASNYPNIPAPTKIDRHVLAKLAKLGELPSEKADDATFLRRVTLDVTGTLPTPDEIRAFLSDSSRDKRAKKVEELLERPAYAAYWANWLCDITGNSLDKLNNVGVDANVSATQWFDWVRDRLAENRPYDEIAEGLVMATSRREGESYVDYCERYSGYYRDKQIATADSMPWFWARQNFRTPEERAIGFAYTFLGVRIQCAQCHKHPFDVWTQEDFTDFQQFFTSVRYQAGVNKDAREMLTKLNIDEDLKGNRLLRELKPLLKEGKDVPFPEVLIQKPKQPQKPKNFAKMSEKQKQRYLARVRTKNARVLGGDTVNVYEYDDPRRPLMDWMTGPAEELFARAIVNRVWERYFGRGIVHPTDDLSLANPPSNAPLLDHLVEGFLAHNYDLKWLHRTITASDAYQRSWKPTETNTLDEKNFARALIRRLPAEAAVDAVSLSTTTAAVLDESEEDLDDRLISDPFRGARVSERKYALGVFGASIRETNCDCDRSNDPSLLQTVYLRNDRDILTQTEWSKDTWLGEIAADWGYPLKTAAKPRGRTRPASYTETLKRLTENVLRQKARGNKAAFQKASKSRLEFIKRWKKLPPHPDDKLGNKLADAAEKSIEVRRHDVREAVNEAYLRTLSRFPTDEERSIAEDAVVGADKPIEGLRDLVWALLNTKEFIVNH